jgi:hypothetical protein
VTFAVTPYAVVNRGGASVSETASCIWRSSQSGRERKPAAPDDGRGALLAAALERAHDLEARLDEAFSERDDVGDEQPGRAVRPSFP